MSCAPACPRCAPARTACASRSRPSTPSWPTARSTFNSPTASRTSSPTCAPRPPPPPFPNVSASCGCSSKTSSSAPTRSPSGIASRSVTARPTAAPRPTRRTADPDIANCVGGVLSPLLANIALSALDDHFAEKWQATGTSMRRRGIRKRGGAIYRLVRYADDFVVMVHGAREHAEAIREEVAAVLATLGLRLSAAKTSVVHVDEGFDFLGWRIQRRRKRGTGQRFLYTYPSKKALLSVTGKVRTLTRRARHRTLSELLHRLKPVLRGWATYFKHGVSKVTFSYLGHFAWQRVIGWLRKRHPGISWARLRRRFLSGWTPTQDGISLFDPVTGDGQPLPLSGTKIPLPWTAPPTPTPA